MNDFGRMGANEAIDNFILGGDKSWTHKYIDEMQVPYCDHANRLICSPAMPPMLDEEDDRMVRAKNEHEAGHARFTPDGMKRDWSGLKCRMVNMLEDLRIERLLSGMNPVFEADLKWLNDKLIGRLQNRMRSNGCSFGPMDEAMMALHFEGNGHSPAWTLSEQAKMLHDCAKDVFDTWSDSVEDSAGSFNRMIEIADEIIARWKDRQKQSQEQDKGQGQGQSQEQDKDKGQEQKQNENQGQEQSQGQGGNQNQGQNSDSDGEKDSDEAADGGRQSSNQEDGSQGKGGLSGDGSESKEDGGSQDVTGNAGKPSGDENGNDQCNEARQCDESQENDSGSDMEGMSSCNGAGTSLDNELKELWKEAVQQSEEVFGPYTAYTEKDSVSLADESRTGYEDARDEVRGAVSKLAGHLEQSLRTISRCRIMHGRDRGDLDRGRLAYMAKSLDRNVFTGKAKGLSLDVSVSILIDESGSIGDTCRDFRRMAVAFCEALDRLHVKFEVLGHTTAGYGRTCARGFTRTLPMKIYEHKRFGESYSSERYRIGSIGSENCNVDGEALLYAAKRLAAQRTGRHIIMVLSDGLPNQGENSMQLREHLKHVIDYCRKSLGQEIYAFGLGTRDPEQYYGKDNFVYLRDGNSLDREFIGRFSSIVMKGGF